MIDPISSSVPFRMPEMPLRVSGEHSPDRPDFSALLSQAVTHVQDLQTQSQHKITQFLSGEGGELQDVAIATQRAELAFELAQQVRNKIVQAYQEVMRTQL